MMVMFDRGITTVDKLIGLIRVSTDKQGKSGLGLEAQQSAIEEFQRRTGATLVKVYTEVESGKHDDINDRPELMKAIRHAKRCNGILVIAKLDRLTRSTIAMSALKTSKVRFTACDNPHANEFTIDILIAVGAEERRKIALRTRDALAVYKATGRVSRRIRELYPDGVPADVVEATAGKLGASLPQCRNLTDDARRKGAKLAGDAHKRNADDAYQDIAGWMAELRAEGLSQADIAKRLNDEGHTTRGGKPWHQVQVGRVLKRA
jgi:DNA invertase Pin-like site-specific DNA recombinase